MRNPKAADKVPSAVQAAEKHRKGSASRFLAVLRIVHVRTVCNPSRTVVPTCGNVPAPTALERYVEVPGFRKGLQSKKLKALSTRVEIIRLLA